MTAATICAYDQNALAYAETTGSYAGFPQVERIMHDFEANLARESVIVDVGCGAGRECRFFGSRGHTVIGVDLSIPLLATWDNQVGSVARVAADMRTLPFNDDAISAIVAASSIIHLPHKDLVRTIQEFARVLESNGMILITFPTVESTGWTIRESLAAPRWFSRFEEDEVLQALNVNDFLDAVSQPSGEQWISISAKRRSRPAT